MTMEKMVLVPIGKYESMTQCNSVTNSVETVKQERKIGKLKRKVGIGRPPGMPRNQRTVTKRGLKGKWINV